MTHHVRAVLFDLDGTLTRPWFDFAKIRAEIGLPEPLLEHMLAMGPGAERDRAFRILERWEDEGARVSELNDGAAEIVRWLGESRIPRALITRNSRRSAGATIAKHALEFEAVVAREDAPVKPRPEGIWLACDRLGVAPAEALFVGDYRYDVLAGRAAGTSTAVLTNGRRPAFLDEIRPDHVLDRLADLRTLVRAGAFPG
jgi:HAD superfamily hydrolase (TIGR01509 family)